MRAVKIAIVNDYEIVVQGLARMLAPFADRIEVVHTQVRDEPDSPVDVTLFDTFGRTEVGNPEVEQLIASSTAGRVVVYTWKCDETLVRESLSKGCAGYLTKTMTPESLVAAIEGIAAGEVVVPTPPANEETLPVQGEWPGAQHGLSAREAEMISLITQGLTNDDISRTVYLSPNTVKSYIRTAYRKIGVTRRSEAVRWGMEHNMLPDRDR
ncbi:LuxR C-terminal-related transcriptional regulator [Ornithinimicrobium sp. Y1847]|uniref:LuxR C-terminal-related transcriptional regulator n=1 Tax=unclassified Ornithinimicrobium TaxID=2615080 RepID=UPI003B677EE0